jgi:diguanylate cyclase (GGDEF)-like protein
MRRASPLVQLTLALVTLTLTLVMMADLFLGAMPMHADVQIRERQRITQTVAVQVAELLRSDERSTIEATLRAVARRVEGVRSLAVRRSDGELVVESGAHAEHWHPGPQPHQMSVALGAGGQRWGAVEVAFEPDARGLVARWAAEPSLRLLVFMALAGALAYGLYMRRALQHLDPASVIPERVQQAFDVMAEGVAVLDVKGRVLLVNRAFRRLHPDAEAVRTGQPLSALPWLGAGLPADPASHPWNRAMGTRRNTSGDALEVGRDVEQPRQLLVNCAPITEPGGAVRGCLATFDDVTELHQANAALQLAMAAATAAREQVQQKNAELLRLATRDSLTGCLNRRALFEVLEPMFAQAARSGSPLGCLVLDIDHFKAVNDTHGHGIGDRVIQEVAKKLQDAARSVDLVCRYGGEEFCVVAPGMSSTQMQAFGERLRARIESACGPGVREVPGLRVTVSIGCDAAGQTAPNAQAMIERADQALYAAKRGGRNRVVLVTA